MKKTDLSYSFPSELIAVQPERPSRILLNQWQKSPIEIFKSDLFALFNEGDLLVLNETKVIPSRLKSSSGEEFLFVRPTSDLEWEVLFPAKPFKVGQTFQFPNDLEVELVEKGLPQKVKTSRPIDFEYFQKFGLINLPPYILSERGEQKYLPEDQEWYQTKWAKEIGSVAAPTASLHFDLKDLEFLESKGVSIKRLTLHVGLGTFLPLKTDELTDHKMHFETVSISKDLMNHADQTRQSKKRVWALGTTVVRALESAKAGLLQKDNEGNYQGETNLFIYPPDFKDENLTLTQSYPEGSCRSR